jgi:hypothetical protein
MTSASRRQLFVTVAPALAVFVAIASCGALAHSDVEALMRDPMATAGLAPLTGLVSNLGVLAWCSAAATTLFGGWFLHRSRPGEHARFLLSLGVLTSYLGVDDFFQLHEELLRRYFGVSEKILYVALALIVLGYLVYFRQLMSTTSYPVLVASLVCLSVSVSIDAVFEPFLRGLGPGRILLEDGSKWLGIVAWSSYAVRTAFDFLVAETLGKGPRPVGGLA